MNETTPELTTPDPEGHVAGDRRRGDGDPVAALYQALGAAEAARDLLYARGKALRGDVERRLGPPPAKLAGSRQFARSGTMLDGSDALDVVIVQLWRQIESADAVSVAGVVAKLRLAGRDPVNAGPIIEDAIRYLSAHEHAPAVVTGAEGLQGPNSDFENPSDAPPRPRARGLRAHQAAAADTDALFLALYSAYRAINRASRSFEARRAVIEADLARRVGPREADRRVPAARLDDPAIHQLDVAARRSDEVGEIAELVLDEVFKLRATSLAGALFRLRLGVDHREVDEVASAIEEAETMIGSVMDGSLGHAQLAALRGSPDLLACYTELHEAAEDRLATASERGRDTV